MAATVQAVRTSGPGAEGRKSPRLSAWLLPLLGVASFAILITAYASVDPDIYWHRVLGSYWIERGWPSLTTDDPVSYTPASRDWFTTSWSVEVVYAGLVRAGGYSAVLGLRLVFACLFVLLLTRFVTREMTVPAAAVLVATVGLPAAAVIQDRPQTLSLILLSALLPVLSRWLATGATPRPLQAALLTWVWANVHGLWLLIPAFFVLAAMADALQGGRSWGRHVAAAIACIVAASFTPIGPKLLLSPFLINSATSNITEWQATSFAAPVTWGLAATLVLTFVGIALQRELNPRVLALSLAAAMFGLMAYRNAVFASLALTPVVCLLWRERAAALKGSVSIHRRIIAALVVMTSLALPIRYFQAPFPPEEAPARIARELRSMGSIRVAPPYNWSGYLREFGGQGVRVAIDGRADRYGAARIDRYGRFMEGRRGWRAELARLDPDVVVVERTSPLVELMQSDGWVTSLKDGEFVMMTGQHEKPTALG